MKKTMSRAAVLAMLGAALAALGLLVAPGAQAQQATQTYDVTIENLTDGQPFTPPVVVAHSDAIDIFQTGEAASSELIQIAENGNNDPMVALLSASSDVIDYATGSAPIKPGESATLSIDAMPGDKLSAAFMLICTNDGFSGVDSLALPVSGSQSVDGNAYDAGSETNTEDFVDIVPPCQALVGVMSDDPGTGESNPALAEGGVISMHAGMQGGTDLTVADHGWTDPVARITVAVQPAGGLPSSGTGLGDAGTNFGWTLYAAAAGALLVILGGATFAASRRSVN